jgi:hypothetical protein
MSDGAITMIVIGGGAAYAAIGGSTWRLLGADWESPGPFFGGIGWPVVLPAMLGAWVTKRLVSRWTGRHFPSARVR